MSLSAIVDLQVNPQPSSRSVGCERKHSIGLIADVPGK
jgi:hypothetical protein